MLIRHFEFEYGGFGYGEEITYKDQSLIYSSWDVSHPMNKLTVMPTKAEWLLFFERIKPITQDWRKKYEIMICDGLAWNVNIQTDEFKIQSHGLHLFPETFSAFLEQLRILIRSKDVFADFNADDYMSCQLVPHPMNRKIKRFMRAKRITQQHLADRLMLDSKELKFRLNSEVTFEIEVLVAIAKILGMCVTDLIYAPDFDNKREIIEVKMPSMLAPGGTPKGLLKGLSDN